MWGLYPKLEVCTYFNVYFLYLAYGVWKIYSAREAIYNLSGDSFNHVSIFGPRDDTNDELNNFSEYIKDWIQWYILHFCVTTAVRAYWPKYQCRAHGVIGAIAMICSLKYQSIIVLSIMFASYYFVSLARNKLYTWVLSGVCMLAINVIKSSEYFIKELGYSQLYILLVTIAWSVLRCCSFNFNHLNFKSNEILPSRIVAEHFFGYVLYFPALMHGPYLDYSRYAAVFGAENRSFWQRLRCFVWELSRVIFWWLVLWFTLHFLYVHYLTHDTRALYLVGSPLIWHIVGYLLGMFFFMYYIISYGVAISFARFDGLSPPNRPRCIGRIHFYSDMWRYFDEGLYEFLYRYIFREICGQKPGKSRRLFATAITFAFIFIWHGCYKYVLIWSVLNFTCIVAEKAFKAFESSMSYRRVTERLLGVGGRQRLTALLATQIFIPAAFSNIYFIGGENIGDLLMYGAYRSGWCNYLILTFCSYCFFQCSEAISKFHDRYKLKTNTNDKSS